MLALLLSSLLSLFMFFVFGTFVTKVAKLPANFTEKLLMGLVIANTVASVLSLFLAINGTVLLGLLVLCLLLIFFIWQELTALLTLSADKKNVLLLSLPFIAIAYIISLNAPANYDTGLYHIQSIEWIEAYPVVPGLANLHGRFGFDPNIFTFFALTSLSGLFKQAIFSVNFTVFSVLTGYFISALYSLYKAKGFSGLLVFFLLVFLTMIFLYDNLSSPTPDFLSITIPLFILSRVIQLAERKELSLNHFIPIIILSVYILTTKMATIPALLLVVCLCYKYKAETKKLLVLVPVLALIVLPWLIRNVILSGWLIYPFPSLNLFSFDWQVPVAKVIAEKAAVTGWARSPNAGYVAAAKMDFATWFPLWCRQLTLQGKLLFSAALCCPIFIFISQLFRKNNIGFLKNIVVITSFAGVVFWLFLAPEFRFGQAFIVFSAISPLLLIPCKTVVGKKPLSLFALLMLGFLFIQLFTGKNYVLNAAYQIKKLAIRPQLIQTPANLTFKAYLINGTVIYAPVKSDKCYCHIIPCAAHIDSTITLRGQNIAEGFAIKQK